MNLLDAELNLKYLVEKINIENFDDTKKILSMGILPGTEITVLQKSPTIVFEVYHSRFTIDNYLGGMIHVRKNNP